jgi:transcriptional regulator with XRE-family HTH domain
VKIDSAKIKKIAKERNLSLSDLLKNARVSKTAYYHLLRKDSLFPASLRSIAETLSVPPSRLITEGRSATEKIRRILAETDRIVASDPGLDPENIRLTLLLLEEPPLERLRRSLTRGRALHLHG